MKNTDKMLLAIYKMEKSGEIARNGKLAKVLGWDKVKACKVIRKLHNEKLVLRSDFAFVTMTPKGKKQAQTMIDAISNVSKMLSENGVQNHEEYAVKMVCSMEYSDIQKLFE